MDYRQRASSREGFIFGAWSEYFYPIPICIFSFVLYELYFTLFTFKDKPEYFDKIIQYVMERERYDEREQGSKS